MKMNSIFEPNSKFLEFEKKSFEIETIGFYNAKNWAQIDIKKTSNKIN
jgi:hypothetical protein